MQAATVPLGTSAQQALANKGNAGGNGVKGRGSCIGCRVQGPGPNSRPSISVALSSAAMPGARRHAAQSQALARKRCSRGLVSVASFQDVYGGVYEDEGPGSVGWAPFSSERFQFQELLGKGGWGTVHLALDTETGQQVAIKSQTKWRRQEAGKKSPSQEVVLQRIRNEGDLLQYMQRSRRVVKLLHRMEDRDNAYLVTEVLEGGDLEAAFSGRLHHFSEPYAAMLLREVLLFLRDCHNSSICFSDVKPANFMLTEDEEGRPMVKAIDFGCAQVYTPGEHLQNRRGTPVYFPPEMFQRCYGLGADVWGAGVMLYRFLSGRFPWFDTDAPKKISPARIQGAVLAMPITFDGAPWTFKSEAAVSLVKGMLSRDPQRRLTVDEALRHPWLTKFCPDDGTDDEPCIVADEDEVEEIRQQLRNNVVPAPNLPPVTSTSSPNSSLKEPLPAL